MSALKKVIEGRNVSMEVKNVIINSIILSVVACLLGGLDGDKL